MKKVELKFNEKVFEVKFGVIPLGTYFKNMEYDGPGEMVTDFIANPLYVTPRLMHQAIIYAYPDDNISLDDVGEMIDADGGANSPQMKVFTTAFFQSVSDNLPKEEGVGKPNPAARKKK